MTATRRVFKLRSVTNAASLMLTFLAVVGAAALVIMTSVLTQQTEVIERAVEVRLEAAELRADLLAFGRSSDLVLLVGDPETVAARDRADAQLVRRLALVEQTLSDPNNHASLEKAKRAIAGYVAVRKAAEQSGTPLGRVIELSAPALTEAENATDQLQTAGELEAEEAGRAVERWDNLANWLGVCLAIALVAGTAFTLLGMDRYVYVPLRRLEGAITRFRTGNRTARAPEEGPIEIRTVSKQFNDLASRLSDEERNRFTFLAGVAHDLRNPLAALRASAQVLNQGDLGESPQNAHATLGLVVRQVDRLERMVGDFLDAARIEAGRLELEPETIDLRTLIDDAVALYRSSSSIHDFRISAPSERVLAWCDPVRFGQVLNNLVSNAVKYSPRGGTVRIVLETSGPDAVISVIDKGIGIPKEEIPHIFEPFRRSGISRELVPGVGLGLSVSRKIIEAHGGEIDVESRSGLGSAFRVRVPRQPERDTRPGRDTGRHSDPRH